MAGERRGSDVSGTGPPVYPGTPRWVRVSGAVAVLLVALSAVIVIGGHGPGGHRPSSSAPAESGDP